MKKWLVYKVISPTGKCYIGQTSKTLEQRKKEHEQEAKKPKYKNNAFKRTILKYGSELKWSIIESDIESLNKSHELEIHWIEALDSTNSNKGYNSTFGGAGVLPTEEVKAKISKSVTIANLKRFKCPIEKKKQQQIIKDASTNPKRLEGLKKARSSAKSRAKTSKDLLERYKDPIARDILALACGGRKFEVYKDNILIGEWSNQAQCARDLNLKSKGHISNCLSGRRKTYSGFSFVFSSSE